MSWSTTPTAAKPLSAETQSALGHFGTGDAVLKEWHKSVAALQAAKDYESRLRAVVVELNFPMLNEGTNRFTLPDGSAVKAAVSYRYDISNKDAKAEKAIDDMTAISQQAGFIADRLIKWTPELSIKEYRLLNPDNPSAQTDEQKAILKLLAPILTITPGSPQVTLEAPK